MNKLEDKDLEDIGTLYTRNIKEIMFSNDIVITALNGITSKGIVYLIKADWSHLVSIHLSK